MTKKHTKKKKNTKKKKHLKKKMVTNRTSSKKKRPIKSLKKKGPKNKVSIKKNKKEEKITEKEIEKIAKTQIKKSFRDHQKKLIKTSYLTFILVFSILTVIIINLHHYFPPFIPHAKKPTPLILRQINSEEDFLKIQNNLINNQTTTPNYDENCQNKVLLNNKEPRFVIINKKYLIILKRGKLFVTNLHTNKYLTKIEISPNPEKENNAVQYNNIYATDNTIIVTGYRQSKKTLEISLFKLSPSGILTREENYELPSDKCAYDAKVINNKFISYTSRNLKTINYSAISKINIWNKNQAIFDDEHINNSQLFYNNSILNAPLIHTITTCQIKDLNLTACRQQHFIDDKINSSTIESENLYVWISHQNINNQAKRIIPSSLIYQISIQNKNNPKVIQIEGKIINNKIKIDDNHLKAIIYQNNAIAPTWLMNFSKNNLAFLSVSLEDFQDKGLLINSPDNYQILPSDISYSPENKFITKNNTLLEINSKVSKIKVIQNDKSSTIEIPENILVSYNIPEKNKLLLIYTKENNLYANYFNYSTNFNLGQEIILANEIDKKNTKIIKNEINSFNMTDNQFISLPIINQNKNNGQLYLLTINSNSLIKIHTLNINKNLQRLKDGCQNSCQEDWTKLLTFFPEQNLNKIYSLTGSYLKSFRPLGQNKLQLLHSINYTLKPAPPKPRRPRAKIPGGAKVVNGKYVCAKKHDYVGKSKKNNKGYLHMDMECCLDPDEYPNPWCTYRPGELSVTKLRYEDYHGRIKKKHH